MELKIRFRLCKQGILRKNKHFQIVYKTGKSYSNKMLVLYVMPKSDSLRRVGFAAGKRLGNAVIRNRVKRLLREAYRLHQHRLMNGVDLLLVGRQPLVHAGLANVNKALLDLSQRAKIMK